MSVEVVSSSAPPDGLVSIAVGVHHAPCSTTPLLGSSLRPGLQKLSQLTDSLYKPPLGVFTQAHESAFRLPPDSALEEAAAVGGYRFSPVQRQFSVSNFGRFPFSLLSIVKGIKSCCISITVSSSNSSSSGRSRTELFGFCFFFYKTGLNGKEDL